MSENEQMNAVTGDAPKPKAAPQNRRVLSGMRPTGKLHIGHFAGAIQNWVRLQRDYECFFFSADWHALTTNYADTSRVNEDTLEIAADWLACGVDPEKATVFIQSHVPQTAELHLLLSMMTPLGWLERVPTYKEQRENIKDKDLSTYGFLGYPVLMTSDILLYQAGNVPVGEDQVAHVEITREIARRFNQFYYLGRDGKRSPKRLSERNRRFVFPEPQPLLAPSPKLPGTDGRKMSKSYGNSILISDPEVEIRKKLKTMLTDPARMRREDKGDPMKCPVGDLHRIFSDQETLCKVNDGCTTAGIGCIECKQWAADHLMKVLDPIQQRRRPFEENPKMVWDILEAGSEKARKAAQATIEQVREAMNLSHEFKAVAQGQK
jgi:tryptophanyl-tRNA synthetase